MATIFTMVDNAQGEEIVHTLMRKFAIPSLNIDFGCQRGDCKEDYGCYLASTNTVCFDYGPIPEYTYWHETGHALEAMYLGNGNVSYLSGEAFARRVEELYLLTDGSFLTFDCTVCGNYSFMFLPDGSLRCLNCGTDFVVNLYDPGQLLINP